MSNIVEIKVPNIGDFADVEVIELLVKPGDSIQAEDSLISVESDKAAMEIPSPQAGVVKELLVSIGDKVSEGSVLLKLEASEAAVTETAGKNEETTGVAFSSEPAAESTPESTLGAASYSGDVDISAEVVVLGSGPGGRAGGRCQGGGGAGKQRTGGVRNEELGIPRIILNFEFPASLPLFGCRQCSGWVKPRSAEVPFLTLFGPPSFKSAGCFEQTMLKVAPLGKRAGKRPTWKSEAHTRSEDRWADPVSLFRSYAVTSPASSIRGRELRIEN